jgi:hypothetical protein
MQRYEYIIELGKSLPIIEENITEDTGYQRLSAPKFGFTEKNKVKPFFSRDSGHSN